MKQFGIFDDSSASYSEDEAVESDFWSADEARRAIAERYSPEDGLYVHEIEEDDTDDLIDAGEEE